MCGTEALMSPGTHRADPHQEGHDGPYVVFARSDGATHAEVVGGTNISDLKRREPKLQKDQDELQRSSLAMSANE